MERGDFDASKADLDARVGQFARKCHRGSPVGRGFVSVPGRVPLVCCYGYLTGDPVGRPRCVGAEWDYFGAAIAKTSRAVQSGLREGRSVAARAGRLDFKGTTLTSTPDETRCAALERRPEARPLELE